MASRPPLLLTVLFTAAAALLLFHNMFYQPSLAQGDHGRDLYAASVVLDGQVPYRDFWWVYGPLMPYYYGLIFKLFGTTIPFMLWGQIFLKILTGVVFLRILLLFIPASIAFIGGLWFIAMMPEFFYTYNHTGGILALLGVTYGLLAYLRHHRPGYLYQGLLACLLLIFIKVNFGLTALAVLVTAPWIAERPDGAEDRKKLRRFYLWALVGVPAVTVIVYALLTHGLPTAYIRQCFPYLRGDQPYEAPLAQTLAMWWDNISRNIAYNLPNRLFALLINIALFHTLFWITRKRPLDKERRDVLRALGILTGMYVLTMQEFWISGVLYRSYWAQPFSFLLMFLVLGLTLRHQGRTVRVLFLITLFFVLMLRQHEQIRVIRNTAFPGQYLALPRGQILIGNAPAWVDTVQRSVHFLDRHLRPGETFFALPYDYIYYYLCARPVPTRLQIFFEHIKVTPEEEQAVINDLEARGVNYIVLSSRAYATREHGLGTFGITYCPTLARYIDEHFETAAQFGDWTHEPGWAWNHGTRILQRTSSRSGATPTERPRDDGHSVP